MQRKNKKEIQQSPISRQTVLRNLSTELSYNWCENDYISFELHNNINKDTDFSNNLENLNREEHSQSIPDK